ncbi:MAG: hypothetical protein WDM96_06520 [Lacunisphaera sp.]
MKRASALPVICLFVLSLLFAGCTTYDGQTMSKQQVAPKKKFFVESNLNDNHAIDHQIEEAIKLRDREAESGPLTMMPDDAQVIITYVDNWTWDFGDHLVYLQITAKDRRTGTLLATANFKAKIPSSKSLGKIIGELLDRMYAEAKR